MTGGRRQHQKSRTGCMTCKQKKIKCDELKPCCQYCVDRSIQCTYASAISASPNRRSETPNGPMTPSAAALTPPSLILSPTLPSHHINAGRQWDVCDLELLHFYTASTSLTFSNAPERRHVWQYVIPRIAFSHEFLLHGLLALSALHLSRISPERKDSLRANASAHHAAALPLFRSALESINSLNCHACSAFGTIIAVYEWASSEHASGLFFAHAESPGEADTAEWVKLLRGSGSIVCCYYEEIIKGPLKPILHWDIAAEHEAESNPRDAAKFLALEQLWNAAAVSLSAVEVDSLNEALRWLKIIYTMITTPHNNQDPASAAMSWPVRVPSRYFSMVNNRQPAALILLSHFCLLLNKVEDFWWIQGMSRRVLQEINEALSGEWETWMGWPLQDLVLSEFRNQRSGETIQPTLVTTNI